MPFYDYPMNFSYISQTLFMIFSGLSQDFLKTLSWLSRNFLRTCSVLSQDFPKSFSGLSYYFLVNYSWFLHAIYMTFLLLSQKFRMTFLSLFQDFLRNFSGNARVIFFLAWVKLLPKFSVFCRKSEECCNFYFIFWHFLTIYGALWYFMALLWHFMPLFGTFGLVYGLWRIYSFRNLCPIWGEIFSNKPCSRNFFLCSSMSGQRDIVHLVPVGQGPLHRHPYRLAVLGQSAGHLLFIPWHLISTIAPCYSMPLNQVGSG